jgi:glycosyltransferase involved in cell wall biosynthesis
MKVLSYVKGLDPSSYHRVFMPNQSINEEIRTVRELKEEDLDWCDILHYSRNSMMSAKFFDELRKKHGFKIILDQDDWWEVSNDHPKSEFWKHSSVALQVRSHMMNADAVICTHDRLANEIRPINPNVYVIPNALDYGKGQFRYKKQKESERVRLLYASTLMNYTNTYIIAGAMKKLLSLNIEVVIMGHHDSPLFDIMVNNLTAGKIPHRFVPWEGVEKYMSVYEGDIGILPSKPTKFNSLKSNLKVLEFAAMKIPVVVSKCDPYLDLPVKYFSGENEFVSQVTELVNDANLRKKCGEYLYKFCKENYSLSQFADKRREIYGSI